MPGRARDAEEAAEDLLFAALVEAGSSAARLRARLAEEPPDETRLVAVLRRGVPARVFDVLVSTAPWPDRPRVMGAVAKNPRTPRAAALRAAALAYWRDLADVAADARLAMAVRLRAESLLVERLPDLRPGERIALARLATPPVLRALLADEDRRVARSALQNPRLREEDLVLSIRRADVPAVLFEEVVSSRRWRESYAVRLALVQQPRTPLALALAQITSLNPRDLAAVAEAAGLRPVVQAAAERARRGRPERP